MPIATNTVGLYRLDNNLLDSSGNNYTLTQNGTVPFVTSPTPPQGTHAAGTFSDANYATAPAGLRTAMSNLTAYTIQFSLYSVSKTNSPVMISWNNGDNNFVQLSDGVTKIRWNAGGANNLDITSSDYIGNSTWRHMALVGISATSRKVYVDGVERGSSASSPDTKTLSTMHLGRYGAATGFSFNGYLDNVRLSNATLSTFPTTDPPDASSSIAALRRRRR